MVEMQRDQYYDTYHWETEGLLSTFISYYDDIRDALDSSLFDNIHGKMRTIFNIFGLLGKEMNVAIEEGGAVGARIVLEDDWTSDDYEASHLEDDLVYHQKLDVPARDNIYDWFKSIYSSEGIEISNRQSDLKDRRNQRWTNSLWYLKRKIVGVIGANHLRGLEDLWNKKTIEMKILHART
ncbi:hypothetical protein KC19_9G014600 [Ceratodon purpureus]|uniref:Uncharacterized protein n=1 Tax=Ceratodon purpureus TaxID=3225 RepID=A0A8T0GMN9_CERPU|nr:hypothetical protein KC19_9G014600 [Ceratodon purpureus]